MIGCQRIELACSSFFMLNRFFKEYFVQEPWMELPIESELATLFRSETTIFKTKKFRYWIYPKIPESRIYENYISIGKLESWRIVNLSRTFGRIICPFVLLYKNVLNCMFKQRLRFKFKQRPMCSCCWLRKGSVL